MSELPAHARAALGDRLQQLKHKAAERLVGARSG